MTEQNEASQEALAALQARAEDLEKQLRAVEADAAARLRLSALEAEASRAGIVDMDGLKLIDSALQQDVDGREVGAAQVIQQLRRAKPWLFNTTTTSSLQAAPASAPAVTRLATEMSVDEWRAARAAILRRR